MQRTPKLIILSAFKEDEIVDFPVSIRYCHYRLPQFNFRTRIVFHDNIHNVFRDKTTLVL